MIPCDTSVRPLHAMEGRGGYQYVYCMLWGGGGGGGQPACYGGGGGGGGGLLHGMGGYR